MPVGVDPATTSMVLSAVAGRPMAVRRVSRGEEPWVDINQAAIDERWDQARLRELILAQGLLARVGASDPVVVKSLRGHREHSDRYVVLEIGRGLRQHPWLADHLTSLGEGIPHTHTASESLAVARSRAPVPEKPQTWGTVKHFRRTLNSSDVLASDRQIQRALDDEIGSEDDAPEQQESSFFLKMLSLPIGGQLLGRILRSGAAGERSGSGSGGAGAGASRRATNPTGRGQTVEFARGRIALVESDGIGGRWYPEWDYRIGAYRPDWCQIHRVPTSVGGSIAPASETNVQLRRVLARFALAIGTRKRAVSGDRLDLPAVVRARVEARAGHPSENVYLATERNRRDLGVLVLLDCSGSSTERVKRTGALVHEVQRQAAAQLVQAWTELGERVACLGFNSRGRTTVHVYPVKGFDDPWGAAGVSALDSLRPGAYTRLGAVIRHGVSVLADTAGTDRLLLVLVSDCHPYDEDYEGSYAEADAQRALAEANDKNIAVVAVSTTQDNDEHRATPLMPLAVVAHAGDTSAFPDSFGRALSQALARVRRPADLSPTTYRQGSNRRSDKTA